MTITQLEYIIAVETHKSFIEAARQCNVSQSTLSMQIKKLEDDLEVILFDRSTKPVQLTEIGKRIIYQARVGINELQRIREIIKTEKGALSQELKIGIIPTLAPYLLPLFVVDFAQKYAIKLIFQEYTSEEIIYRLFNRQIDVGILVTPLENESITEFPLFYESFVGYIASSHPLSKKQQISFDDLDIKDMWLLKEGHCLRPQVLNICGQSSEDLDQNMLQFDSGSIETLYRIVEKQYGYTLLPELTTLQFNEAQKQLIRPFTSPIPTREVSLVIHKNYAKIKTIMLLRQEIQNAIPESIKQKKEMQVIHWRN